MFPVSLNLYEVVWQDQQRRVALATARPRHPVGPGAWRSALALAGTAWGGLTAAGGRIAAFLDDSRDRSLGQEHPADWHGMRSTTEPLSDDQM